MRISISGTPGTGKSSVSKVLSKRLGFNLVDLNSLAEEKGLYCGLDRSRETKIVDVEKIEKEVDKIKGNVILDGHYSQDIPNDLTVVLRCNPRELRKRMNEKGWGERKIEENIQAEIMEICLDEARILKRKVIEIDTTGSSPGTAAKKIISFLKQYKLWKLWSPTKSSKK